MADLALTPTRRAELIALLEDQERLKAQHPKLSDYLETAPFLQGTGDDEADTAFDLRMIHYLTGGSSVSSNPYWDIVSGAVTQRVDGRVIDGGTPQGSARLAFAQTVLQESYAYAVPSPETIAWVAAFCGQQPLVEIGAGRGYWAAQISRQGIAVEAFDLEPPDSTRNPAFSLLGSQDSTWCPVQSMAEFGQRPGADYVLLLCWPPGWGNPMASNVLSAFEETGGTKLIYVGEPQGGKTADDQFFHALSTRWSLASSDAHYPSWWNLDDHAQGWIRALVQSHAEHECVVAVSRVRHC